MSLTSLTRGGVIALCLALLALSGCRTNREAELKKTGPDILYERAKKNLDGYDFQNAIRLYEALTARFPFTEQARQARIDLIYAYYRAGERESAIDAADTFIRENPTHPRLDYAYYVRGLVDFDRAENRFERLFRVDLTERPPTNARKAFASFRTVVEQYPRSLYAHDARQRMIWLRNRLADYECNVARYYMKRGAYVAAAQRAKYVVENYDGAPAVQEALETLISAYERLDLQELAAQGRQVYADNFGSADAPKKVRAATKPWWKVWGK